MSKEDAPATERGFAKIHPADLREAARVTSTEEIQRVHARLKQYFKTGKTKSYEWRMEQLRGLERLVKENQTELMRAVSLDLGRPSLEAFAGEIMGSLSNIQHVMKNLATWMEPEKVSTPLLNQPAKSFIVREPKGVLLAISPWNFPITLTLDPLLDALAAGNCCVVKPSEVSVNAEKLIKALIEQYLDRDAVAIVTGGVEESTDLLKLHWDHICYTGNGAVGRVVARAAAEHLTPITLELGGKSPTLVLPGANIKVAARRILLGKFFNAGQICIAPDYALLHKDVAAQVKQEMKSVLHSWYGPDAVTSDSFSRIINGNHFNRVKRLVESSDGEVVHQGKMDEETKFMPPTLVEGPSLDSAIMQEEIFGPVLPILEMASVDDMIAHINAGEKPLALYVFGTEAQAMHVIARTSSGGVCVNDVLFQFNNPELPFGGVGSSGMGRYHGKWGFIEFSHIRSVLNKSTFPDVNVGFYPPYNPSVLPLLQKFIVGPMVPAAVKNTALMVGTAAAATACGALLRSRL